MTERTFKQMVSLLIEKGKREKVIYDNGLDLINFVDEYQKIISILLKSIYGSEVGDIINDFIFDSIYDEVAKNHNNYLIYDTNSELIADVSTIESLYKYAEERRQLLISAKFSYDVTPPMSEAESLAMLKQIFS